MADQEIPKVDRSKRELTDGSPVPEDRSHTELLPNGQQKGYIVLSPEERRKGFVRPVRRTYKHVGVQPKYPIRPLSADEIETYSLYDYSMYEEYPEGSEERKNSLGRYWTKAQLRSGCGSTTTCSQSIAETYARDPKFYSGTFCVHCQKHFDLDQFIWVDDGEMLGT